MKKDLNETCLISEDRMIAAEKAYSVLKKQHETDAEAHGKQVADLEASLAGEREAKSELESRAAALEESKAAASEAKRRELAEAAAEAEARLESMTKERA